MKIVTPHTSYWPLFKHMSDKHGLTLLDSELEDIIRAAKATRMACFNCGDSNTPLYCLNCATQTNELRNLHS
jgi:hypothetical protein